MIDSSEAMRIARERAAANGWPFGEPVEVRLRRGWFGGDDRYDVETNAGRRGTKARFTISASSGKILSEGYISR